MVLLYCPVEVSSLILPFRGTVCRRSFSLHLLSGLIRAARAPRKHTNTLGQHPPPALAATKGSLYTFPDPNQIAPLPHLAHLSLKPLGQSSLTEEAAWRPPLCMGKQSMGWESRQQWASISGETRASVLMARLPSQEWKLAHTCCCSLTGFEKKNGVRVLGLAACNARDVPLGADALLPSGLQVLQPWVPGRPWRQHVPPSSRQPCCHPDVLPEPHREPAATKHPR